MTLAYDIERLRAACEEAEEAAGELAKHILPDELDDSIVRLRGELRVFFRQLDETTGRSGK